MEILLRIMAGLKELVGLLVVEVQMVVVLLGIYIKKMLLKVEDIIKLHTLFLITLVAL